MKKPIEERFSELMDANEEIQRIEKPNACRFFVVQFLISFFAMLIISVCAMIELVQYYGFGVIWAPCAISALCILIYMLFSIGYYKNTFYCITNKRVIIRSGIVGADYKAVFLKDVSSVKLKRIWYDNLFKKQTGTIILGKLEDKDIELSFDEMGALYRLSGVENASEIEQLLKETIVKLVPKDKTNSTEWKMVYKEQSSIPAEEEDAKESQEENNSDANNSEENKDSKPKKAKKTNKK